MENIINRREELIGRTPLLRLREIESYFGLKSRIYAKLESRNLTGSIKDRAALYMLRGAVREERVKPGGVVVEATSGNLGISLSAISPTFGLRSLIVMPDSYPEGRKRIMESFGGEVLLCRGGMSEAIALAREVSSAIGGAFYLDQFNNPHNLRAHFEGTGSEIYYQTNRQVDLFVCGVGSSGSLCGVGKYLKGRIADLKIVAVEPEKSAVLSGKPAGFHGIFGIGAGIIPPLFDYSLCDKISTVFDEDARLFASALAKREGISAGLSSGAALSVAVREGKELTDKNIVILIPDGGEKYV